MNTRVMVLRMSSELRERVPVNTDNTGIKR